MVRDATAAASSWLPATHFRIAQRWEESGEFRLARLHYSRLLELEPDHVPALHNLVVAEIRDERWKPALDVLRRLAALLGTDALTDKGDLWPALAYSIVYNEAVAHAGNGEPERALISTDRLVIQLLRRLERLDAESAAGDDDERLLLERLEAPSVMFAASMRVVWKDSTWPAIKAATSMLAPRSPPVDREELLITIGPVPGSLDSAYPLLAEWYTRAARAPRIRYNRACYASRLAARLDGLEEPHDEMDSDMPNTVGRLTALARDELELALTDDSLLRWVERDPALAFVRAQKGWKEFLERQRPVPKTDPGSTKAASRERSREELPPT